MVPRAVGEEAPIFVIFPLPVAVVAAIPVAACVETKGMVKKVKVCVEVAVPPDVIAERMPVAPLATTAVMLVASTTV